MFIGWTTLTICLKGIICTNSLIEKNWETERWGNSSNGIQPGFQLRFVWIHSLPKGLEETSSSGMKEGSLKEDFLVEGEAALQRLGGNLIWEKWLGMEYPSKESRRQKPCILPKSKVVEAQGKSGPMGKEKARKRIIFQNRTEMGTNVQELESRAREFVFYLVGDGEPPNVFLWDSCLYIGQINSFGELL